MDAVQTLPSDYQKAVKSTWDQIVEEAFDEGMKKGREEVWGKGMEKGTILLISKYILKRPGETDKQIAALFGVSAAFVQKVRQSLQRPGK